MLYNAQPVCDFGRPIEFDAMPLSVIDTQRMGRKTLRDRYGQTSRTIQTAAEQDDSFFHGCISDSDRANGVVRVGFPDNGNRFSHDKELDCVAQHGATETGKLRRSG
jgi:hypothetical protein